MKPGTDGEITYYEQLGVEPTASAEQIRETHRSLVRLLHPDQQTDLQLKAAAEAQMRILNRIYSVLSEPDKRAKYDLSLRGVDQRAGLVFSEESVLRLKLRLKRGGLAVGGAVLLAALIWSTSGASRDGEEGGEVAQKVLDRATGSTSNDSSDEVQRLRGEVRDLENQRNRALQELAQLRGSEPPASAAVTAPLALPAATGVSAPRSSFGGAWHWTRAMEVAGGPVGSYHPEFIEATLLEQDGVIKGSYKARYRTPDSSINPDVSFEFAATVAGPILICPWTGPGGARGQVMIRQTSKDSLQIDWTANQLGVRQKISTGTAVLARKTLLTEPRP